MNKQKSNSKKNIKETNLDYSPLREFWCDFYKNKGAVLGLFFIVILCFCAIFAPLIAPHDPTELFPNDRLRPPVWLEGGSFDFILGTDDIGRDLLSRIIHGARLSLMVGVVVITISLSIGTILGLIAGYHGGWIERFIMRLMDILMGLPSLLLAIAIIAILGPSLFNAILAIAIVVLPEYVRLTRSTVLTEKSKDYVLSSKVSGAGDIRIMFNTILPNTMAPLIVQATLGFSGAVLSAAALGFLGLGAQPPSPEWGAMLADARQFVLSDQWWVITFPGIAILITVLSFNLAGDGLRDALDPKMKS